MIDSTVLLYCALLVAATWLMRMQSSQRSTYRTLGNIPGPSSHSWLKGNFMKFFDRHGEIFQQDVALNYGPIVRLEGRCGRKILYVSDPKALHTMLIKEENVYEATDAFFAIDESHRSRRLIFGECLLATAGEHHRRQRKILNPVFSVSHMRHMLPIFYNVIFKLREVVRTKVEAGKSNIDVLEWTGRAALELIGQGGLGYSFDPLATDTETRNEYGDALKALNANLMQVEIFIRYADVLIELGPRRFRRFVTDIFPHPHLQRVKDVIDTMDEKSRAIFREKETALENGDKAVLHQVGEGKDIMSVFIKANNAASEQDRLPENELIAQMSLLLSAATDTTSNMLSRILYLLAEHRELQRKLREEILESDAGSGNISYDELNKLPLLDAVCRETLRRYPPVTNLVRAPRKDSVLPLSEPICGVDGTMMKEVAIPKGTELLIGTFGCNVNKALWGEDSLEWKPERWLSPLPRAVTEASIPGVYSNLMSFMGGKRACIGFKFSEMEMKVVLSVMLSNFTFELTDKPIEWNIGVVWYPTIGRHSDLPQLLLKVGLYKA
ncbi:hypothetical protein IEO21_06177 [Rhodonia placenta]|uniref:Cytochrome P450 n=1 Tax=Rhodonia placenta TaxID=104341 RepID=A0A8H7P0R0_9APHY|nr:hypothetical protein IEO21_06177 [Postia placenta]